MILSVAVLAGCVGGLVAKRLIFRQTKEERAAAKAAYNAEVDRIVDKKVTPFVVKYLLPLSFAAFVYAAYVSLYVPG